MLDNLAPLIQDYGYLAIAVGCFFEGETAMILGAFAAVNEYLRMPTVVAVAFLGTLIGDNVWFWLGRRLGRPFLRRNPVWRRKSRRVEKLARRHATVTILSVRFLYGLRSVTPFMLGAARVHPLKFMLLDTVSASIWALLVGWLSWMIAVATSRAAQSGTVEWFMVGVLLSVAAVIWLVYFAYSRLRRLD